MEDRLKERLPFPYDQDLSQVLRRLDRRTVLDRVRLANDPVTVAYLVAAARLVERDLGPIPALVLSDPEAGEFVAPLLARYLSQRAVAAEVAGNPDPFPRVGSVSTLRAIWKSQSDFIADLWAFISWSTQISAGRTGDAPPVSRDEQHDDPKPASPPDERRRPSRRAVSWGLAVVRGVATMLDFRSRAAAKISTRTPVESLGEAWSDLRTALREAAVSRPTEDS